MKLLTKSKYLLGLQCPKLLWTAINDKEKIPEPDNSAKHKFEQGTLVGVLATKWFSEGIDLADEDYKSNLKKTEEALKKRKPIFEAGFEIDNLFSRGVNLKIIGWNYPKRNNLQELIMKKGLYPITIFKSISEPVKQKLFKAKIVLAKDLINFELKDLKKKTGLNEKVLKKILDDAKKISFRD